MLTLPLTTFGRSQSPFITEIKLRHSIVSIQPVQATIVMYKGCIIFKTYERLSMWHLPLARLLLLLWRHQWVGAHKRDVTSSYLLVKCWRRSKLIGRYNFWCNPDEWCVLQSGVWRHSHSLRIDDSRFCASFLSNYFRSQEHRHTSTNHLRVQKLYRKTHIFAPFFCASFNYATLCFVVWLFYNVRYFT